MRKIIVAILSLDPKGLHVHVKLQYRDILYWDWDLNLHSTYLLKTLQAIIYQWLEHSHTNFVLICVRSTS